MGRIMTESRIEDANAIKQCLRYIQKDAEQAGFNLAVLHIKLAIMEVMAEGRSAPRQPGDAPAKARSLDTAWPADALPPGRGAGRNH
ncbi:hypothetical protein CCR85_07790 [Rhodothalassium salexigens]|nr:hypothetical protein [Rhodothalassium salexigens]